MSFNQEMANFITISKTQTGKALETCITQILENPKIFVFGEFLQLTNYKALGPSNKFLATLNLFAFDDYQTYIKNKANYIPLTEKMAKKLKMISIADMADIARQNLQKSEIIGQKSALNYDDLMK